MKNILIAFGTRPEAIKMAPLILELAKRPEQFRVTTCVTAQHREMLDQVLDHFGIRADVDLNLMTPGQDLYDLTSRVLVGMRDVLRSVKPHACLVHGDTTTSFATSLAAFYQQLPVGHVEAGLRTHQIYAPFPEEINRSLTARIAAYHFAPTDLNRRNLVSEGIDETKIFITGNTVVDALLWTRDRINGSPERARALEERVRHSGFNPTERRILLVTGHRRENFGKGFENICRALLELATSHPDIDIVYPVHLNPSVKVPVEAFLSKTPNIHLIHPLDYETFTYLMMRSSIILTDSGGIQEEGPSLGKPVLVMREVTERPDGIDAGTVKLVGTATETIVREVSGLLQDRAQYAAMTSISNPYGDGTAAARIADLLLECVEQPHEGCRKIWPCKLLFQTVLLLERWDAPGAWRARRYFESRDFIRGTEGLVRCSTEYGLDVVIYPSWDKGVEQSIFRTGAYEQGTLSVIQKVLRPGDRLVDIGSNVGMMTLVAAKAVGAGGRVDAFEPLPEIRYLLTESVKSGKFENVGIHACALGASESKMAIHRHTEVNLGSASLAWPSMDGDSIMIDIDTLDRRILKGSAHPLRMIKIDVEGWELEVLKGGIDTLKKDPQPVLCIEFSQLHPLEVGTPFDMVDLLGNSDTSHTVWPNRKPGLQRCRSLIDTTFQSMTTCFSFLFPGRTNSTNHGSLRLKRAGRRFRSLPGAKVALSS